MSRTFLALALAAAALNAGGCGTVCNLTSGSPEPYGGVATDLRVAASPLNLCANSSGGQGPWQLEFLILGIWLADLGISAVADTLTLPVVYCWDEIREARWLRARPYEIADPGERARYSSGAVAAP